MPNPIVTFTQSKLTAADTASQAAVGGLADAQAEARTAREEHAQETANLAAADKAVADVRALLAASPMPADAEALSAQLEDAIMALRTSTAAAIDAEEALRRAEAAAEAAKAVSDRAGAELAAAQAAHDRASAGDAEREAWKEALEEPPLSTLRTDAAAALTSDEYEAAEARVEADVPTVLRERALARGNRAVQRAAEAADARESAKDALGAAQAGASAVGAVEQAGLRFVRAEAALREYVSRGRARHDTALGLVAAVTATAPPTAAEAARIQDPEVVDEDAAGAEEARDEALATVEGLQATLEDAILAALRADVDADPTDDAAVQAAQDALTAPTTELQTAEGAYTQALRTSLQRWEATVPDPTWRALDAFREATAILTELAAIEPADLVEELEAAETAYATALGAADKSARTHATLEAELAARAAAAAVAERNRPVRAFSAVRGDS
jgi:hypothetical protein